VRIGTKIAIVLVTIALCTKLSAHQTVVIIDLTEQAAYLLQDRRVALVSPIASGKEGWGTPIGSFRVISKDLNHQSGNFGLIGDSYGRIVNPNATPFSYVPSGCHYMPAPNAILHGISQIRRDACGFSARLPGIARLCSDAQRPRG
jgi:hypothetical protein